jgi:hypothetical protein
VDRHIKPPLINNAVIAVYADKMGEVFRTQPFGSDDQRVLLYIVGMMCFRTLFDRFGIPQDPDAPLV